MLKSQNGGEYLSVSFIWSISMKPNLLHLLDEGNFFDRRMDISPKVKVGGGGFVKTGFVISGFRSGVNEICDLAGFNVA
jgi:hypothetical protein